VACGGTRDQPGNIRAAAVRAAISLRALRRASSVSAEFGISADGVRRTRRCRVVRERVEAIGSAFPVE
jgi:hypothetical protein